jgi:hypothetical protein
VFTTGHGAELPIPANLQDAPVIGKPYDPMQLRTTLRRYLHNSLDPMTESPKE